MLFLAQTHTTADQRSPTGAHGAHSSRHTQKGTQWMFMEYLNSEENDLTL